MILTFFESTSNILQLKFALTNKLFFLNGQITFRIKKKNIRNKKHNPHRPPLPDTRTILAVYPIQPSLNKLTKTLSKFTKHGKFKNPLSKSTNLFRNPLTKFTNPLKKKNKNNHNLRRPPLPWHSCRPRPLPQFNET